jgi:hypothetical protein
MRDVTRTAPSKSTRREALSRRRAKQLARKGSILAEVAAMRRAFYETNLLRGITGQRWNAPAGFGLRFLPPTEESAPTARRWWHDPSDIHQDFRVDDAVAKRRRKAARLRALGEV